MAKSAVHPDAVTPAPLPTLPSVWTPTTVLALLGGVAAFVLGILTAIGTILPAGVSHEVALWAGTVMSLVGTLTPLAVLFTKNSVTKAALAVGIAPEVARRL